MGGHLWGSRPSRQTYLAAGLLVAAVVGGVRAADLASSLDNGSRSFEMAGASWRVTDVDEVVGVSKRDLMSGMGGMGHNIGGLVTDDQMMIKVSLAVTGGDHGTSFNAGWLRAYEAGSTTPILPTGGSLGSGALSAHAIVEGTVTFVVPRDGGHLVLRGRGTSHVVDLTTVDQAPHGAYDHEHHSH
jgi:hypothetical protein